MRHGKYRFVASFLAVPLVLYVFYVLWPYAQAFNIALTNWNGFAPPVYVGFANFQRMFHDQLFIKAVEHNLFLLLALPLLFDTIQVAWVYLGIAAFDAFALVQVLTVEQGGPDGATTVLANEIYRSNFVYSRAGYASAMGVALFFLTLAFAALAIRITRRERIEF